jgi:hypothetical protein
VLVRPESVAHHAQNLRMQPAIGVMDVVVSKFMPTPDGDGLSTPAVLCAGSSYCAATASPSAVIPPTRTGL